MIPLYSGEVNTEIQPPKGRGRDPFPFGWLEPEGRLRFVDEILHKLDQLLSAISQNIEAILSNSIGFNQSAESK